MLGNKQSDSRLARYLLGGGSQAERDSLESKYFEDEEEFEAMLIAEDELVDAYARGELSGDERRRFEKVFLASPEGRERVNFALALAGAVSDARPVKPPVAPVVETPSLWTLLWTRGWAPRLAAAAASIALIAVPWLLVERSLMKAELNRLHSEQQALNAKAGEAESRAAAEQLKNAELRAQLEAQQPKPVKPEEQPRSVQPRDSSTHVASVPRKKNPEPVTNVADATLGNQFSLLTQPAPANSESFDLTSGTVRGTGGHANTLRVNRKTKFVMLRLTPQSVAQLITPYESYRAAIETPEGKPVWNVDSFGSGNGNKVYARIGLPAVPAERLTPGYYFVRLEGKRADGAFEKLAEYSFRIVKK